MERILFVDDNSMVRKVAREMIAGEGYEVADARSHLPATSSSRRSTN